MIDLKQPLKKIFMMGMLMLLMPLSLIAQDITVTGVVKDATGESVIGATVMQKGTSNGAVTDIDGNFTLKVPSNATLTISYVGYATQDIAVNGKTEFSIVLKEDSKSLSEVVVVGYGTMDKNIDCFTEASLLYKQRRSRGFSFLPATIYLQKTVIL